jgi:hypothetical protein
LKDKVNTVIYRALSVKQNGEWILDWNSREKFWIWDREFFKRTSIKLLTDKLNTSIYKAVFVKQNGEWILDWNSREKFWIWDREFLKEQVFNYWKTK